MKIALDYYRIKSGRGVCVKLGGSDKTEEIKLFDKVEGYADVGYLNIIAVNGVIAQVGAGSPIDDWEYAGPSNNEYTVSDCDRLVGPKNDAVFTGWPSWNFSGIARAFKKNGGTADSIVRTGVYSKGADDTHDNDTEPFKTVLRQMSDTYTAKNNDYGSSFTTLFKELGMTYAYGHLKEKLERIHTLMNNRQQVKQESILDSLMDLANYAVMTIAELKKEKKE